MINDLFNILLPQTCLGIFIFIELIFSIILKSKNQHWARFISLIGILLSFILLSTVQIEPQYFAFKNSLMSDNYTLLFHFLILICGFLVALITNPHIKKSKINSFTFHSILLTALLGAMCIVSANDFLTLLISIELLSFPLYFLIASSNNYLSKEASFKYLITSAISTGVFLFGVSYLYGLTSSLNLSEIYELIVEKETSLLYIFSVTMIVTGLFAKLAIFPFANWIIDVYKGTETSILAFLSTIPKLALFGIICRLIVFPLSGSFELTFIIAILSIITAFWANTFAIRESNVKSILACSSAANASYVMLTACLVSVYNLSTVLFYLICYVLINIAAFTFLNITEYNNLNMKLTDFKNLAKKNQNLCIAYVISILALAGFPITSGFVAKIYLFSAIAHSGLIFIPFLIILLILTVVALFYYLKLIKPLFEITENSITLNSTFSQKFVIAITTIITIIIGIYPEKLIELCKFIAYNI